MYFITQGPCCLWILVSEYNFILWSVSWWSSKTSKTLWWSSKAPLWRSSELVIIFQNWVKVKRSSWPVATNAGPGKIFHDFITNVNFLLFPFLFPPMLLQENIKLLLIVRVHFDFIKRPQHKKWKFIGAQWGLAPSFEAFRRLSFLAQKVHQFSFSFYINSQLIFAITETSCICFKRIYIFSSDCWTKPVCSFVHCWLKSSVPNQCLIMAGKHQTWVCFWLAIFFPTLEVCILTYSFHLPAGAVYLFWPGVRFRIEFWPTYGFVVLIISTLMEILVHTAMKYAPKNLEAWNQLTKLTGFVMCNARCVWVTNFGLYWRKEYFCRLPSVVT